jgi:hypothetical protein
VRGRSARLALSTLSLVAPVLTGCASASSARTDELEAEVRRLRERVDTLEAARTGGGKQEGGQPGGGSEAVADAGSAGDGGNDGENTPAGETQHTALGDQAPISAEHSREEGGRIKDEATPKDQGAGAQGPGPRGAPETAGSGQAGPARQEPSTPTDSKPALFSAHVWGVGDVELHGSVDVGYTYNPALDHGQTSRLRLATEDNDTFELEFAQLGFARPVAPENAWDGGGRLDVVYGRFVERTISLSPHFLEGEPINVAQAYVDLQAPTPLGRPLLVRAGRFIGWFGVESPILPLNVNFSVSYLFQATPFTTTGVAVGMDLVGGLRYTQYLVNGWDVVIDTNGAKTLGGQLAWTLNGPQTTVAFNWIYGAERADDVHDQRLLLELDATWQVLHTTELLGAVQYGEDEGALGPSSDRRGRWRGVMLIARQDLLKVRSGLTRFGLSVRGEYARIDHAPRLPVDADLWEATATVEVDFTENVRLGFEYRHDHASDRLFDGPRGALTRSYQDTYSVDFTLNF